ncbi:putative phage abortive infection protein [Vibrio splendidus]|uniref:putative phage abortive infection protein n=1 Tax=Vibrio splendidus TaxID=29497 RepID=UPI000D39F0BE|nr:putative phage abortive infection protein [Vibrio splendidus]PTP75747.1 hypothetical protein CWO00_12695 [Vibrio splendidus]
MTINVDSEGYMERGDKIIKFAMLFALLVIPLLIFFLWQEDFTTSEKIDNGKFGTFGDFFGGVLGSIWSLCGVLLFYTALKEQRRDFKNNEIALTKQVAALELQSQEFSLQREELAQTRKVFIEQSKTLMQQRLESTYFSLLSLYNKIVSDLSNKSTDTCYFKEVKDTLCSEVQCYGEPQYRHDRVQKAYLKLFYHRKEDLSHFFKLLYRVIKTIDISEISEKEKFRYIKIIRSQLSENEMFILYYNSHSHLGGEFYKFILKYNLLKHLPITSKLEFKSYIYTNGKHESEDLQFRRIEQKKLAFLHRFNDDTIRMLKNFNSNLNQSILDDDFESYSESYLLPGCDDINISLTSEDTNMINIEILTCTGEDLTKINEFYIHEFKGYFQLFLYDIYVYSQYKDAQSSMIEILPIDGKILFKVELDSRLSINNDIE